MAVAASSITQQDLQKLGIYDDLSPVDRENLQNIMQIFPDVDPQWAAAKLQRKTAEQLAQRMFARPYQRKWKNPVKELRRQTSRKDYLDRSKFDPAQLLQVYPDPAAHFRSQPKEATTAQYKEHVMIAMLNEFPNLRLDFLKRVLAKHNHRLYPAYKEVAQFIEEAEDKVSAPFIMNKKHKSDLPWPETIDRAFFTELQFAKWEQDVIEHERGLRDARTREVEEARIAGVVMECECCVTFECPPSEMFYCNQNHAFCKTCIQNMVNEKISQGSGNVTCLSATCNEVYLVSSLCHVLNASTFDRLIRITQLNELRQAEIPNLCSCPLCDFAMVIDNPNEKLFNCLNPECLKVTCRECKELNHIPIRCDEVEKDEHIKFRTYVEEQCAKALIRNCPKCHKPIVKDSGCNKMSCPCGTSFCYMCNEALEKTNPYNHFRDGMSYGGKKADGKAKCVTMTSMKQLHEDAARKAGKEARHKYLMEHPDMRHKKELDINTLVQKEKSSTFQMGGRHLLFNEHRQWVPIGGLARRPLREPVIEPVVRGPVREHEEGRVLQGILEELEDEMIGDRPAVHRERAARAMPPPAVVDAVDDGETSDDELSDSDDDSTTDDRTQ